MNELSINQPKIKIHGTVLETTSLNVAQVFGRRHKDVIRKVENLGCSVDFTKRNFTPSDYKDNTGRVLPAYNITQDGFTLLAMGFTGKKAMQFKEAYIEAFNTMETELLQKYQQHALPTTLTPDQKRSVQEAVNETGKWQKVYGAIKTQFRVATYKEIPTEQYDDVMTFIGEWLPEDHDQSSKVNMQNLHCATTHAKYLSAYYPELQEIKERMGELAWATAGLLRDIDSFYAKTIDHVRDGNSSSLSLRKQAGLEMIAVTK